VGRSFTSFLSWGLTGGGGEGGDFLGSFCVRVFSFFFFFFFFFFFSFLRRSRLLRSHRGEFWWKQRMRSKRLLGRGEAASLPFSLFSYMDFFSPPPPQFRSRPSLVDWVEKYIKVRWTSLWCSPPLFFSPFFFPSHSPRSFASQSQDRVELESVIFLASPFPLFSLQ